MEVTRHNFSETLEEVEKEFKSCCIIAFDAEFTSLPSHESIKPRLFDDATQRYNRVSPAISTALITQIGLTFYTYERNTSAYHSQTYTFHLRPQTVGDIDQTFRFQASTLEFLCRHGFDFNKFIYDGIPYLSRSEMSHIERLRQRGELVDTLLRGLDMAQEHELQEKCSAVSLWLSKKTDDSDTLYLEPSTPVMRYLLHTEIRNRFPGVLTTNSLGTTDMVLVYRDGDVEGARSTHESELTRRLFSELLGFSRVMELLAECRKPTVGHNVYFDLVLLHNQFIGPIPKSYSQFKRNIKSFIPDLYDTKHIAASLSHKLSFDEVWKSTSLQELYEYLNENKCKRLKSALVVLPKCQLEQQKYHEAGWDSYCAGYILIRLGGWLANEGGCRSELGPVQTLSYLNAHKNKVNLMRCGVQYTNLDGDDPPRHRPPLMFVRSLKKNTISLSKVAALLSGYGTVDIQQYGKRAALVAPATRHTAEKILNNFSSSDYRITTYSVYRHSPIARIALWGGALVTGGALALFVQHRLRS